MTLNRSVIRSLILPIYLPGVCVVLGHMFLLPVIPIYATQLTDSYGLMGLMLAAGGLGMLVTDLPAGMLLSRIGRKRVMLMGTGGLILSLIGLSIARTLPTVILLRFASGMSMSLWGIGRHSFLAEATVDGGRGRAISTFGGIMRICRCVSPAIGGLIAEHAGIRPTFLCSAFMVALGAVFVALFVTHEEHSHPAPKGQHGMRSLWTVVKQQRQALVRGGTGQLLGQMTRAGRVVIPLFASKAIGLGLKDVGYIQSIAALADASMFIPAGILMDRLGRKFAIVPCFLIQGAALSLVPFTVGFSSLLAVACLASLGNGLGSGCMMTLGADLAPPGKRGEFLGAWRFIGDMGFTGSPLIIGFVSGTFALATAPFVISGIGILAGIVFLTLVPETLVITRLDNNN